MRPLVSCVLAISTWSCAEDSTQGRLPPVEVVVDPSFAPPIESLPGFDAASPRPLATVVDGKGHEADFVANELWLSTNDTAALDAFLSRWGGQVLSTFDPPTYGLTDLETQYLIRVDASTADTSRLAEDLRALDPRSRGLHRVSSEQGTRLLAAGAREAASGDPCDP